MVAAGIGAPAFKLTAADNYAWQFHFFEWMADSHILQVTAVTASPGFYGTYSTYFPSPISEADYPSSGANIGWTEPTTNANMN